MGAQWALAFHNLEGGAKTPPAGLGHGAWKRGVKLISDYY